MATGDVAVAQVIFVPAFGDEMNQMRRMVALAAKRSRSATLASCVFDLGCGGNSADCRATVDLWLYCRAMVERLRAGAVPLVLIGCRLTLAARLTHDLPARWLR